jgi:ABC-type sugar transport system substrate-binding protein
MEAFLKAEGRNIHVLYAHNDDMAIGAIQAIEEAGLVPGKDILIVSIDAVKGAFEAMIAGKLNASIECNPLLGPLLMSAVKDVMAGKSIPKRIVIEESVFTQANASEALPTRLY